ncbi:hypothetical protein K461DRAFT_270164 [Myriangium duriaei CBS 260.36]|uniref:Uncharacterized protein n=1 Tax=Myriangium duriaei CBS 260.36 TaxID=1168546 RepID=A0A9P4MI92_9PEZI|nr:hypothetical protein K461DRAFT_270164 [Myriangium duriaei CBS 260.36]
MRPYVAEEPRLLGYLIQPKDLKKWHKKLQAKGLPMYPVSWEGIHTSGHAAYSSLLDLESRRPAYGRAIPPPNPWLLQEFEMSLCTRNDKTGELGSPLHTYCSSSARSQMGDVLIQSRLNCFEVLPELFLNNHSRPIGDQVIALEASIQLPSSTRISGKSELAIYLSLQGPRVAGAPIVDTITTFYQACNQIERQERLGSSAEEIETADKSTTCYQIPFCSSFWASTLSRLGGAQQRATDMTTSKFYESATDDVRAQMQTEAANITRRTAEEIRTLTAVQQVSIYSKADPATKHHFTLRWQFKAASTDSDGHVSWRLVELPGDDESPLPSPTESIQTDPLSQGGGHVEPITPDVETFDGRLASPIALKGDAAAVAVVQQEWANKYEQQEYGNNQAWEYPARQMYDPEQVYHAPGHTGLMYDMQTGRIVGADGQPVFILEAVPMDHELVVADDGWHVHGQQGEVQIDPWLAQGGHETFHGQGVYYAGHDGA